MYGLLALHRAPTDADATTIAHKVDVVIEGGDSNKPAESLVWKQPMKGGLAVLPALFRYGPNRSADDYRRLAEPQDGPSEKKLSDLAKKGSGYVAGSYPERSGEAVFHTVALAEPTGKIVARYRATHLDAGGLSWARAGDKFVVVSTAIGRIALVLGDELAVPEVFGVYSAQRADLVAAPSGLWSGLSVELDPKLFNKPYPPGTPYAPYAAAVLGQFWVAAAGWSEQRKPAALLLGPEPVIATPPVVAGPGEQVSAKIEAPWSGTWINQEQLIGGQQPWNTVPLVLATGSECLKAWSEAAGWVPACW